MDTIAPFKVSICGIEELADHCEAGVSHVLSILDPDWPVPDAFGAFDEHTKLELRFHDIIEEHDADRIAPQQDHVADLLTFGRGVSLESEAHLLVHCHAGVSRSTASMALILAQALPNLPGAHIFEEILRMRPRAWPNLRILELGDAMLGRRGELVVAAIAVYRTQLDTRKYLADQMRLGGRGREIEAAAA